MTTESFGKPVSGSLPTIIRPFKSAASRRISQSEGTSIGPIWQRNYYEHIIRTERALYAIRRYIAENPARWPLDKYNSMASSCDPLAVELWHLLKEDGTEVAAPIPSSCAG
jgi:putative transposase